MEANYKEILLNTLDRLHVYYLRDQEELNRKIRHNEELIDKLRAEQTITTTIPKRRAVRGLNKHKIYEILAALPDGEGMGAMDIRRTTGLAWSSIRQILHKHTGTLFVKGPDGLWRAIKYIPNSK